MEKKWRAENSWEGEVKRKSWRYDYFSSRAGSEKSAPPITNQYNFARDVRAMFVFWNRVLAIILFVLTSRLEYEKLSLMLSYYKNGAVL